MEKSLEERIRHAVDEGRKARSEYYDVIDLPNEQQLGAPAPNELIIELETRLGKKLPPSYRVFLSLYDGWRMVDGAMDLLSIGEMLEGAREKKNFRMAAKGAGRGGSCGCQKPCHRRCRSYTDKIIAKS